MTTSQVDYTEPPIVQGILSAVVAIAGVGIAAVSLIGMITPPMWLTGWLRLAPLAPAAIGWLLFIRFTRNDRNIVGRILGLELDIEDYKVAELEYDAMLTARDTRITTLEGDVSHLKHLLANPQRSIIITDRSGTRTEPMHARNLAWTNAVALVRMTEDFGILPGREPARLTREAQAEAIQVLQTARVIVTNGNINRLTVPVDKAIDVLNWLAPDTPTPMQQLGSNPGATSGLGLGEPSMTVAGEVVG